MYWLRTDAQSFDAVVNVNVSVEEQGKDMTMAADIIQKARDILIHIESQ